MPDASPSTGCHLLRALAWAFDCPPPQPALLVVLARAGRPRPRTDRPSPPNGAHDMAETSELRPNEQILLTIKATAVGGGPGHFDGPPTWTHDSELVDLRVAEDGMSALVGTRAIEEISSAVVTATGDARQGSGVNLLPIVFPFILLPADVEVAEGTAGFAEPRTDAAGPDPAPAL